MSMHSDAGYTLGIFYPCGCGGEEDEEMRERERGAGVERTSRDLGMGRWIGLEFSLCWSESFFRDRGCWRETQVSTCVTSSSPCYHRLIKWEESLITTQFIYRPWATTNKWRVSFIRVVTDLTLVTHLYSRSLIKVSPLCCFGTMVVAFLPYDFSFLYF
jgi:hypothetical protein